MKNNVKDMLKQMSDEQEIHDIQDNILKNVDMNKVRPQVYVKESHPKRFLLLTNIFSALAAAMVVVLVVLIINLNTPNNQDNLDETNNTVTADDVFENNYVVFTTYLEKMLKQEAYNIINIGPSIGNINFNEVVLDDKSNPRMTVSEEEALADDMNSMIYNIEEMLGIASIECTKDDNSNNLYPDYENVISVTGPLSQYKMYFTETSISAKNVGETNFKEKSNITGVLAVNGNSYQFDGQKEYKNSKTTYTTKIKLNNYSIVVNEVFGKDNNEFTYTFFNESDSSILKTIYIKQIFDDNGNVKSLKFKNQYTSINIEKKNVSNDSPLVFKIDSRQSDTLTVTKENNQYKYEFENSSNVYTK